MDPNNKDGGCLSTFDSASKAPYEVKSANTTITALILPIKGVNTDLGVAKRKLTPVKDVNIDGHPDAEYLCLLQSVEHTVTNDERALYAGKVVWCDVETGKLWRIRERLEIRPPATEPRANFMATVSFDDKGRVGFQGRILFAATTSNNGDKKLNVS